jgi:pimeloyl-ACP methyl ester carboxylesterase
MEIITEGDPQAPAYVFLHGWPETSRCWREVMRLAAASSYAVAPDLPGIGGSAGDDPTDGSKAALARVVRGLVEERGLRDVTLVGHDCGGMVAFAYLREYADLRRAVIMNTVVPGVAPWEDVRRNPYIWHFGLHGVPELPELLVQGHQRRYFDYFYDVLSPTPDAVPTAARDAYAAAYASDAALAAGFGWYRAFSADAEANRTPRDITTPLLYLRGEHEGGRMADYAAGFRAAGVRDLSTAVIPGAGHFAPDQAPDEVWRLIQA